MLTVPAGRRGTVNTALAAVAAVLAREFGAAVIVFGSLRPLRTGTRLRHTAATYLPAIAALFVYLAYGLPAVAALAAEGARDLTPSGRLVAAVTVVCATTLMTQRPWQQLDSFRDRFPYYIHRGDAAGLDPLPSLWPIWGWRFLIVAGVGWMLATSLPNRTTRG